MNALWMHSLCALDALHRTRKKKKKKSGVGSVSRYIFVCAYMRIAQSCLGIQQLANTDNLGCILLKDREINAHNF